MKKRIGLIDFGSNTFHLVIASMSREKLDILYHQRAYVFLAQSGISTIAEEAMQRGIETVTEFHTICTTYEVDEIIAVGTAALRSADNSRHFTSTIRELFDIRTQIIDGQREADLIYRGMAMACPDHKQNALFIDIGGGSTEFILTSDDKVVFQDSFPLGLGVLKNKFPFSDPVDPKEIYKLNNFLDIETDAMITKLKQHAPLTLIGGSGTFDVLAEAITGNEYLIQNFSVTEPLRVLNFISERIHTTLAERMKDEAIPDTRVHLIIHAFQLISWILDKHSFQSVAFSKFALKEGLLQEYYETWMESYQ